MLLLNVKPHRRPTEAVVAGCNRTLLRTASESDEMGPPAHMIRRASESESYVMLIDESHEDRIVPCDFDIRDLEDIVDLSRLEGGEEMETEVVAQKEIGPRENRKRKENTQKEEQNNKYQNKPTKTHTRWP